MYLYLQWVVAQDEFAVIISKVCNISFRKLFDFNVAQNFGLTRNNEFALGLGLSV